MQGNALKKMVVGKLVLMGCDYSVTNAMYKSTGLYKLEKAEKTPVGLWLAYFKAQLPVSKLQKTTSVCIDLECYIYFGLFSWQVRHEKPVAVHEEKKVKLSVAKV